MTESPGHLSSLALDRRALGALSQEETDATETHLAGCASCQKRLEAQQESLQRFQRVVAPALLPSLKAKLERSSWLRLTWLLVPAVAAAAVVVGVRPRIPSHDDVAIKGGATFQVFARRGGEVFRVTDGARLRPGDTLRFAVQPGGLSYVLIASRDEARHAAVYYPFDGAQSTLVDPRMRSELPGSIELDATPGEETLFALFSRRPLHADTVMARIAGAGTNPSANELGADEVVVLRYVKVAQ
jgi:hypothetical protein